MAEQAISCPWQAPPAFLAARVVAEMLDSELRWGPHFAQLRLVSRGWREAADDALPALTPRQYLPTDEVAPLARRFRGLRLLRLESLSESAPHSFRTNFYPQRARNWCLVFISSQTCFSPPEA